MALNAKLLVSAHLELIREIRALRVMTANAGQHLTITRVEYFTSHRMTEFPLSLMTTAAHGITITLEHGRGITTMGGMTRNTLVTLLMT